MTLIEDNESTFQIIKTGKNPTMRHISRTHGVNVQWLHDVYNKGLLNMMYTRTEAQLADVFTKTFRDPLKYASAVQDIGIARKGSVVTLPPTPGPRAPKEDGTPPKTGQGPTKKRGVKKQKRIAKITQDIDNLAAKLEGLSLK